MIVTMTDTFQVQIILYARRFFFLIRKHQTLFRIKNKRYSY